MGRVPSKVPRWRCEDSVLGWSSGQLTKREQKVRPSETFFSCCVFDFSSRERRINKLSVGVFAVPTCGITPFLNFSRLRRGLGARRQISLYKARSATGRREGAVLINPHRKIVGALEIEKGHPLLAQLPLPFFQLASSSIVINTSWCAWTSAGPSPPITT